MIDHVVRCVCKKKKSNKSLFFFFFDLSYQKKGTVSPFYSSFATSDNVMSKSINVSTEWKDCTRDEILIFILQLCNRLQRKCTPPILQRRRLCEGGGDGLWVGWHVYEYGREVQTAPCVKDSAMIQVLQYEQFFKYISFYVLEKWTLEWLFFFSTEHDNSLSPEGQPAAGSTSRKSVTDTGGILGNC